MKNPWQWMWEWNFRPRQEQDADRARLPRILQRAESYSIENPDARIELYEQGRDLAVQLEEPWWVILFENCKCETLLYYKHDPEAALQLAAKLVVETRKPHYRAFPQRITVNLSFIAAYSKIDPVGYQKQIRDAMEAGQAEWSIYEGYYEYYWQLRARFLIAIGDSGALEAAWQHYFVGCQFQEKQASPHYTIYAIADLLNALWLFDRDGSRTHTGELAELGLQLAPTEHIDRLVVAFTMWRALGARYDGDERVATQYYRRALERQARLIAPRNAAYSAALAFHETGGEWEKMLKVCDEAIDVAVAHRLHFETVKLRWQKCEILKRLNLDWHEEAERLREVVATMPSKTYWEEKLATLEESA